MNEFSKLNRDQMRKITGGVGLPPEVCNVGGGCAATFQLNGHNTVLFGLCEDTLGIACRCVLAEEKVYSSMCFIPAE